MDNSIGRRLYRGIASLSIAAILAGVLQIGVVAAGTFQDVKESDWFFSFVEQLVEDGVIDAGDKYRPGDAVNRAELAKMLVEATGLELETPATPSFSDVAKSAWYYSYVETAKANGILSGNPDGTFKPSASANRAEASKMIVNAFGLVEDTTGGPHFPDVATSAWYYAFVETAYNWSVVDGNPDGTFRPADALNRAAIAKLVVNSESPVPREEAPPDEVTVGEGALEVSLASDSPVPMSVPNGSAYNKLTVLEFTASNDADVDVKGITITRGGFTANTCITGVSVWDSAGNRHGNIVQSLTSEGKSTITFATDPITVPAGSSETVAIKINISSADTCQSGTINIGVASAAEVDSTAETIEGTFPVVGATHSLVSGTGSLAQISVTAPLMSVGGGSSTSPTELNTSDTGKELLKVKFNENSSYEDAILTDMNVFIDGTISAGDLVNFKLTAQDGKLLAEVAGMSSTKYVNFKLAEPYTIPKGTSRYVTMTADVATTTNNANRTILAALKNDYDLMVKGATTGAYLLVTAGTETFPEPDNSESYWFKIKEGTLTLSKASASPSGFIPIGADDVLLATYDLKATGEDMEMQKLGINISGAANSTGYLRGTIRYKLDGQTVYSVSADTAALYDDGADDSVSLSTYYTIKAGQTAKLTVEGSIKTTGVAGVTYKVEVDDYYTRRVSSNNYAQNSTALNLEANSLTVEDSALAISNNGAFSPANIVKGSSGVQVGSFKFQAGNAEDINVTSINVKLVGNESGIAGLYNVTLKKGTTQLGTTISTPNANGDTISVTGFTVGKNTTEFVDVYLDATSAVATATLKVQIPAAGVNATGKTSNNSFTTPSSAVDSPSTVINILTSGTLSLQADATGTPIQQILHSQEADVDLFKLKVNVSNAENITLDKLYFGVANGEGNVTNLKLYDHAGAQIGSTSSIVDGQVKFTGLNKMYNKGDIKTMTLKGTVTGSGVLAQGALVVAGQTYAEYTGVSSGSKTLNSGGMYDSYADAGDLITVYDITQFEGLDRVYIDANGDGDMLDTSISGLDETTQYTICDLDTTNKQFTLDNDTNCDDSSVAITHGSSVDGRISPVNFNSKTMIVHDVEPVIAKHANSLSGTQGGQLGQQVGSFTIKADGGRDLVFSKLRTKVSGSYVYSSTYGDAYAPMGFELWRADSSGSAATQLGNGSGQYTRLVGGTLVQTGSSPAELVMGTTAPSVNAAANNGGTNSCEVGVTTGQGTRYKVDDIVDLPGIAPNAAVTIVAANKITVTSVDGATCTTLGIPQNVTDNAAIVMVARVLGDTDKIKTASTLEFDLGSTTETITAGSTGNYVVEVDTSGIKDPSTQGTSTLTLRIDGLKGGTNTQVAGAAGDPNTNTTAGLTWGYVNVNGTGSGALVVTDSYPVDSNTITY